jgi:hypothetical protein
MITVNWLWDLVGVISVVAIWSAAWKDNPLFRLAENTLVGAMGGYLMLMSLIAIERNGIFPIYTTGKVYLIIPLILGILTFSKFTKWYWLYRYPIALVVATGVGLSLRTTIEAQFISQITATILPLNTPNMLTNFNNLVIIMFTVICLVYFFFTISEKGTKGRVLISFRKLAIYMLMMIFGAGFASGIMDYVNWMTERMSFVLRFLLGR